MTRQIAAPPGQAAQAHLPWWVNPICCLAAWTVPLLLLSNALSPEAYTELWLAHKFVDQSVVNQGLILAAALAWGSLMGIFVVRFGRPAEAGGLMGGLVRHQKLLQGLYRGGLSLTLTGYAFWVAVAIARGLRPIHFLHFSETEVGYALKHHYFETVPGFTTMTQFGPATVLLGLLMLKLGRRTGWPLGLIVLLGMARGFFLSERLAFLEIVVPAAILALRLLPTGFFASLGRRALLALSPVAAVFGLMVFFTAFEYNRSWVNYYSKMGLSLWEFGSSRLTGYYVTAFNNSAMWMKAIPGALPAPYYTFEWLWTFPGISNILGYEALFGTNPDTAYYLHLGQLNNPEFNNWGGLLIPIVDYGLVGATAYWTLAGLLVGSCYALYRQGRLAGLLMYPILFQGLMELPRLLYLVAGRAFPSWVLILGACLFIWLSRMPRWQARRLEEATS